LGCGPAAHSFFGGKRFSLRRALAQYCRAFEQKTKNIPASLLDENYTIDEREAIAEYIMLRLRLCAGIDSREFSRRFGLDFDTLYGDKCARYIQNGFMTFHHGVYALTPAGMFISNYILSDILEFEDFGRYYFGG
jgi:oxygen-independent coproporphyrinogen-3 oxidase